MSTETTIREFANALFSSLPDGNYVFLSESGEILEAVASQTNPLQVGQNSIGKSFQDLLPESLAAVKDTFTQVIESGTSFASRYSLPKLQLVIKLAPCLLPNSTEKYVLFSALELKEETDKDLSEIERSVVQYEENLHKEIIKIFNWRHEIEGKGNHKDWMEKALPNLNTSLMQGSGLGALVTTVGSLIKKAKKEGSHHIIPSPIYDLLEENFSSTKKLVKTLAEAQIVFEGSETKKEITTLKEFRNMIQEEVSFLSDMAAIKNQRFHISNSQTSAETKFYSHFALLRTAIRELLINAMKYGQESSDIYVLFMKAGEKLSLKILNAPMDQSIQQINFKKSEEIILFQPFYRVNKYVDERFSKEEFGLGLGLPIVKKILEDMNAKIYFNLLDSNIYNNQSSEVSVTLEFDIAI
ncbi:ATP-binding protein [Leptospira sp. 85282-16]|uniref:histidine kinase n=1 Tax=Leptospira montravelensis TaxID=2484961 RepID=A0ABY2LNT3_9LEPT|nr:MULTISPECIES: ATP-binding protein [Leptospira]MCT8334825.1 ATP-binding protein [Leptospira sp. 85282-16]TGK81143.1 ATP-binding protein [Leptospira montravelensis]TGL01257.1 ATP-binding protein [Leptospira montravelensis]